MKRTALRRTPMTRRYVNTGPSRETLAALQERCGGRCELCGQAAEHTHHRRPRGIGSSRDPRLIDRGSRWVYLGETYVEHPEAS